MNCMECEYLKSVLKTKNLDKNSKVGTDDLCGMNFGWMGCTGTERRLSEPLGTSIKKIPCNPFIFLIVTQPLNG